MAQHIDHATFQLYENYHTQVHVLRDTHTYDHFSASRTSGLRQAELLPTYLREMIRCIHADLTTRGDCWLLRAIINRELPSIHLLDQSAIAYVYSTLFTPEETPVLDTRSIPYSSDYSTSVGGMLYTDRHAKTSVLDLRSSSNLHLLCHALLMYAAQCAMQLTIDQLSEEKAALNSRITQLSDRIIGLEHDLAAALKALEANPAEVAPAAAPDATAANEPAPAEDTPIIPDAPVSAEEPVIPEAAVSDEPVATQTAPLSPDERAATKDPAAPETAADEPSPAENVTSAATEAAPVEEPVTEADPDIAPDDEEAPDDEPQLSGRVYKHIARMRL